MDHVFLQCLKCPNLPTFISFSCFIDPVNSVVTDFDHELFLFLRLLLGTAAFTPVDSILCTIKQSMLLLGEHN